MKLTAGQIAKFLTALVGVAGTALTLGLVSGNVAHWVAIGISIVTAIGVYLVPNSAVAPVAAPKPVAAPIVPPGA